MDNGECPVATNVKESINITGSISNNKKWVASHFIANVFPSLVELAGVGYQNP